MSLSHSVLFLFQRWCQLALYGQKKKHILFWREELLNPDRQKERFYTITKTGFRSTCNKLSIITYIIYFHWNCKTFRNIWYVFGPLRTHGTLFSQVKINVTRFRLHFLYSTNFLLYSRWQATSLQQISSTTDQFVGW